MAQAHRVVQFKDILWKKSTSLNCSFLYLLMDIRFGCCPDCSRSLKNNCSRPFTVWRFKWNDSESAGFPHLNEKSCCWFPAQLLSSAAASCNKSKRGDGWLANTDVNFMNEDGFIVAVMQSSLRSALSSVLKLLLDEKPAILQSVRWKLISQTCRVSYWLLTWCTYMKKDIWATRWKVGSAHRFPSKVQQTLKKYKPPQTVHSYRREHTAVFAYCDDTQM